MTMQPKATTGLLAAIVVLLAANLVMQNSEPAVAAGVTEGPIEPYVVEISSAAHLQGCSSLYRRWSDGAVDVWRVCLNTPGNVTTIWYGWVDLIPVQRADMNADGCVGIQDFLVLLGDWDCES